jgi:AcrR family transcriptional regulator
MMTDMKRGRGRPRRQGADEEILTVARELLRDRGYREFTVDAISERTGIAKTTVYRRFPSKGALVAAAIAPMHARTDTDDVTQVLRETATVLRLLSSPEGEAIDVIRAVVEPRRGRLVELLKSDGTEDADLRADLLIGALLTRLLVTRAVLENEEAIVEAVLA